MIFSKPVTEAITPASPGFPLNTSTKSGSQVYSLVPESTCQPPEPISCVYKSAYQVYMSVTWIHSVCFPSLLVSLQNLSPVSINQPTKSTCQSPESILSVFQVYLSASRTYLLCLYISLPSLHVSHLNPFCLFSKSTCQPPEPISCVYKSAYQVYMSVTWIHSVCFPSLLVSLQNLSPVSINQPTKSICQSPESILSVFQVYLSASRTYLLCL